MMRKTLEELVTDNPVLNHTVPHNATAILETSRDAEALTTAITLTFLIGVLQVSIPTLLYLIKLTM